MRGGKRAGAGRKKGTKEIPKVSAYFTDKEMRDFIKDLKERASKSDKIAVWLGDQIFGKAPQTIEGNLAGTLTITFDSAFTKGDESAS